MRSRLLLCTLLVTLGALVSLSTGELEYYDGLPDSTENIEKQLFRYLNGQARQQSERHRRLPPLFKSREHSLAEKLLAEQKERNILEFISQNPNFKEILQKKEQLNYQQPRARHGGQFDDFAGLSERELQSYFNREQDAVRARFDKAPFRVGFPEETSLSNYPFPLEPNRLPFRQLERNIGREMKEEEPFLGYRRKEMTFEEEPRLTEITEPEEEFTFRYDEPEARESEPFAVTPNDPRYYQDTPFSTATEEERIEPEESTQRGRFRDEGNLPPVETLKSHEPREMKEVQISKFREVEHAIRPELHRRAEDPLVTPVEHHMKNDIYFIAIVAGCSAAAMFALVLISLTWCRLQRGAKAAADIEYPAYGITGPNKDISPSGDQRLAQSAQMYHFQHQKQQIIAMEKTAAARDPGSVSEAESDEENEEGDYTVYECPGLAPTGEMEVKNPLFHDDPTPATPAQNNQDRDHM